MLTDYSRPYSKSRPKPVNLKQYKSANPEVETLARSIPGAGSAGLFEIIKDSALAATTLSVEGAAINTLIGNKVVNDSLAEGRPLNMVSVKDLSLIHI